MSCKIQFKIKGIGARTLLFLRYSINSFDKRDLSLSADSPIIFGHKKKKVFDKMKRFCFYFL